MNDSIGPQEQGLRTRRGLQEILYAEEAQISLLYPDEPRMSVLDVLLIVTRNLRIIGITTAFFAAIGLAVVLSPEDEKFSASATVVQEGQGGAGGGALLAFSRLGIGGSGGGGGGLTPATYPAVLMSREVRLAVARDSFYISTYDTVMVLTDYLAVDKETWPEPSHRINPQQAASSSIQWFRMAEKDEDDGAQILSSSGAYDVSYPSPAEQAAVGKLSNMVSTGVDSKTGLMSISASADDPQLAADLPLSFAYHLQERVQQLHTEKLRQDLQFIQARFEVAEAELAKAEENLAHFMDTNRGLGSAQLTMTSARLERVVEFKAQLYAQLQAQLANAELELQRGLPVLSILERPATPGGPASTSSYAALLFAIVLGLIVGVALAFAKWFFETQTGDDQNKEKLGEIRAALPTPTMVRRTLVRRLSPWKKNGESVTAKPH